MPQRKNAKAKAKATSAPHVTVSAQSFARKLASLQNKITTLEHRNRELRAEVELLTLGDDASWELKHPVNDKIVVTVDADGNRSAVNVT